MGILVTIIWYIELMTNIEKQWDFVYKCGMELQVDIERDEVNTDMVG